MLAPWVRRGVIHENCANLSSNLPNSIAYVPIMSASVSGFQREIGYVSNFAVFIHFQNNLDELKKSISVTCARSERA